MFFPVLSNQNEKPDKNVSPGDRDMITPTVSVLVKEIGWHLERICALLCFELEQMGTMS